MFCDYFRIIGVLWSCTTIEFRHAGGMSRFVFFCNPCMMLMQWTGQKLHGASWLCLLALALRIRASACIWGWCDILLERVSSVTFCFVFSIALCKSTITHNTPYGIIQLAILFIMFIDPKHNSSPLWALYMWTSCSCEACMACTSHLSHTSHTSHVSQKNMYF